MDRILSNQKRLLNANGFFVKKFHRTRCISHTPQGGERRNATKKKKGGGHYQRPASPQLPCKRKYYILLKCPDTKPFSMRGSVLTAFCFSFTAIILAGQLQIILNETSNA